MPLNHEHKDITIVHLSNSLGGGGAEQMVFQLANQSHPNHKTIVISLSSLNTIAHKFTEQQIEVHYLNITSFKNASLPQGLKLLHEIIKDYENVIFHCHQYHGGLLGILYNFKYKRVPIAYTMHTNKVKSLSRRWILFLTKPFRKKDIIFSKTSNKWYLKNCEIIPNGVDFEGYKQIQNRQVDTSKPFVFLYLGRLSTPKNPLALVDICKTLKTLSTNNFELHIVGDGHLAEHLKSKIHDERLESHFKLFGFQNNIKSYLEASNCLILPSIREGMPVAVIEAAASKLPVIATPVGSIPDFLNLENAYVTNIEQFADKMNRVMTNYSEALKKSDQLYRDIEPVFNIHNVYKEHLRVYKSIL